MPKDKVPWPWLHC